MIQIDPIDPTASDFGQFVFCGLQWFYRKREVDRNETTKKHRNDISSEAYYREIGKDNEHRCVEWVLKKNYLSASDIIYVGTNNVKSKFLTFKVKGIKYRCKPDLIVDIRGQRVLYEFKSVGDPNHLGSQFDNNLAQIWCYTKLLDYQVDKFYLLQYFIDPFYTELPRGKPSYSVTEQFEKYGSSVDQRLIELLPKHKLDPNYYDNKFAEYLKTIEYISTENTKLISRLIENSPREDGTKRRKCYSCEYRKNVPCPIGQALP